VKRSFDFIHYQTRHRLTLQLRCKKPEKGECITQDTPLFEFIKYIYRIFKVMMPAESSRAASYDGAEQDVKRSRLSLSLSLPTCYVGRLAPSPSGSLHIGHANTFFVAMERAQEHQRRYEAQKAAGEIGPLGPARLIFRVEDLDEGRCREHFIEENVRDLKWLGISWAEGPGCVSEAQSVRVESAVALPSAHGEKNSLTPVHNGSIEQQSNITCRGIKQDEPQAVAMYYQRNRGDIYKCGLSLLIKYGYVYASPHSRREVAAELRRLHSSAEKFADSHISPLSAPNEGEVEPIFPITLRPTSVAAVDQDQNPNGTANSKTGAAAFLGVNWRFRVPDDEVPISFTDARCGTCAFVPQRDFGDFIVFAKAGYAAYEMAVVLDDSLMGVTEVVRGEDLLLSTARQILVRGALRDCVVRERAAGRDAGFPDGAFDIEPSYFHCPLLRDESGKRLSKRNGSLSLAELREAGWTPQMVRDEILKSTSRLRTPASEA
jgi:glutamyl-tRNA synthetase